MLLVIAKIDIASHLELLRALLRRGARPLRFRICISILHNRRNGVGCVNLLLVLLIIILKLVLVLGV